jgi:biopolymer transport protein ExbD
VKLRAEPCIVLCLAAHLQACANGPEPARCPNAPPATTPAPAPAAAPAAAEASGTPAIPYELPKAGEVVAPPPDLPGSSTHAPITSLLAVEIDGAGALSVDGKRISDVDELTRIARDARAADPDTRAIIKADRAASWGIVVAVIDRLKQGGIAKLAFAVSPVPAP